MVIGCLRLSDVSVICRVVNPRRTSQNIFARFLDRTQSMPGPAPDNIYNQSAVDFIQIGLL